MTSKEFVLWLKGFTDGVHEYNISPKQWDILKDKLVEVKDEEPIGFPFGVPNTGTIQTLPFIQPYNPYTINCGSGSSGTITTTPVGGSITYATPQFVTSTTNGYPSGSNWSYTTNKPHNED